MNALADSTQKTLHLSPLSTEDREWISQMELLADQLRQLHALPLLAHDVIARSIFQDIAHAPDMEEISRQCDLLLVRIEELLQEDASSRFADSAPARGQRVMMKL